MKELKDYKNFGEVYDSIGEKNFGNVAFVLILMLVFVPFLAGIVNYVMLYNFYHKRIGYFATEYNYKCMTLWNFILLHRSPDQGGRP